MHSTDWKVSGTEEKSAEAMRAGSVDVRVVPCSLQACNKCCVVSAGNVRERKLLLVGGMILDPDQRLVGLGEVEACEVARGRRTSRFGRRGLLMGRMVLLVKGGGSDDKAARKSR